MNKHGRPTDDKKGTDLNLRMNDEMRAWIKSQALSHGMSMSEYIRHIIKKEMLGQ